MVSLDLKSLQNQLKDIQKKPKEYKLSERTIVDIVSKIAERGNLKLHYTQNGKEYVTDMKVLKEIQDEVKIHQGIISKLDLIKALDINQNVVEANLEKLISTLKGPNALSIIEGKIVTNSYLDRIVDEVNLLLKEKNGSIYFSELSNIFDFSIQFFKKFLDTNVKNGRIKAIIYPTRMLTTTYISSQKNLIKPILIASLQPISLTHFTEKFGIDESIVPDLIKECIQDGIKGTLKNNIFEPTIYKELQIKYLQGALNQNGHIEYSSLNKIGITNPQEFIKENQENHSKGIFLTSSYLDYSLRARFESAFYENVFNGKISNTSLIMEISLEEEDINNILEAINFDVTTVEIIQGNIIPNVLLQNIPKDPEYIKILNSEIEKHIKPYSEKIKEYEKKKAALEEKDKEKEKESKDDKKKKPTKNTKSGKKDKDNSDELKEPEYNFSLNKSTTAQLKDRIKQIISTDDLKDMYDLDFLIEGILTKIISKMESYIKDSVVSRVSKGGKSQMVSNEKAVIDVSTNPEDQYSEIKLIFKSYSSIEKLSSDSQYANNIKAFSTYYSKTNLLNFLNNLYLKQITHMKLKPSTQDFGNANARKEIINIIPDDDIKNIFVQLNDCVQTKNFALFISNFEKNAKNLAVSVLINDKKRDKLTFENVFSASSTKLESYDRILFKSTNLKDYLSISLNAFEKLLLKIGLYLPLPLEAWSPNLYYQTFIGLLKSNENSNGIISDEALALIKQINFVLSLKDDEFDADRKDEISNYLVKLIEIINN